jgi:hypothetical protein
MMMTLPSERWKLPTEVNVAVIPSGAKMMMIALYDDYHDTLTGVNQAEMNKQVYDPNQQ